MAYRQPTLDFVDGPEVEWTVAEVGETVTVTPSIAAGSITAAHVAADIATQAELDAVAALVGSTGHWEIVMEEDGVTNPPVPVETETEDDWVYAFIED